MEGNQKVHKKRGFRLLRDAKAYEAENILGLNDTVNMTFGTFVEKYKADVWPTLKVSTQKNREFVIDPKILPYFDKMKLCEIKPRHIIKRQNQLIEKRDEYGNAYSDIYLKKIRSNLNSIFNHAERYYDLKNNPIKTVKSMGKERSKEVEFWSAEEYMQFREVMKGKPEAFYAFELLYWTGMRLGEMMALTKRDINLENKTVRISKTYQVIEGVEYVTSPKTEKSNRVIDLPDELCNELEDFLAMFYGLDDDARPFNKSKAYYESAFKRGIKKAGVKEIKVHALRHSHISYLISKGFTAVEIGSRTGQESMKIVMDYAHMMPSRRNEMVEKLQSELKSMNSQEVADDKQNI